MALRRVYDRREGALLVAFSISLTALVMALLFEWLGGYVPCKLCLQQRWAYYIGVPLALAAVLTIQRVGLVGMGRALAVALALVFLASLVMGAYHAGVEWKFWAGPADCGGRIVGNPGAVGDFRAALDGARVIRCDEASGRVLGLSFAGWNVIVSALIIGFALRGASNRM